MASLHGRTVPSACQASTPYPKTRGFRQAVALGEHLHLLMAPTFSVLLNTRDTKAEIFVRGGRPEEIKVDVEISELEPPEPERVPRLTSKWKHYEIAK
jgi:broad specificity phosphatase PhoE